MTQIDPRDEEFRNQMFDAFQALVDDPDADANTFDLYAQPLHRFEWAQEYVPGLIVHSAGGMVPFQAEGTINGYPFYYRSEWGGCDIKIGRPEDVIPYLPEESYWSAYDNEFEGSTFETFIEGLTRLLPKLHRTPTLWRFEGHKSTFLDGKGRWEWVIDKTEKDEVFGWGETAEEGYQAAAAPSEYLAECGFTPEMQNRLFVDKEVSIIPSPKTKIKLYPDNDPKFPTTPYVSKG